MNFDLTEEQRMICDTADRVGADFGPDYWLEKDRAKAFPQELWQAICDAGLCGVALSEEHGGSGLGMQEMALIVEHLAATGGGATLGQLFMINPIFGGVSLSRYGSAEQQAQMLPELTAGRMNFSMALTEPDAGSNTLELRSFARADGDGWRLSGQKIWITGVKEGHKMLVVARTRKVEEVSRRTEGLTMFMIDIDRPGLTFAPIEKLGTNTLSSCGVFFDDVRIEPHELVGTLHGGWFELLEVLNTERIVTTAALIGAGDMAIRQAVEYAQVRKVFRGTPIGAYQGVQFPLAQAHAQLQTARLMNLKAAWLCDQGRQYGSEANTAKLIAAQAAMSAIEHAMQTLGGMGYARESHLERLWRDARLFKFAPVAEEMVLNFIATHDLGLPRGY